MRNVNGQRVSITAEVVAIAAVGLVLLPLLWTAFLSFQPNRSIVSPDWSLSFWLGNYSQVLGENSSFTRQAFNSVVITLSTVGICLAIGSFAGYAVSKLSPPKWLLYPTLVFAALIPLIPPITLVPGFVVQMQNIGLLGTVLSLVIMNTVFNLPFAALLMKSYFDTVPDELREAAMIDGASESRLFRTIMLPIVKPGLAAVGVFVAIMAWNEFLFGLTMTSGGSTAPLTVGIASLVQPYEVTWGQMAAAGSLAALPIIVLAIFANRYIVAGLSSGAVKG